MSRFGFGFGFGASFGSGGGGIPLITQRNFTTLDAAFSMSWTIPTLALTANYNIKSTVYFQDEILIITGSSSNFNNRIRINANGSIDWRPDGSSTTVSTATGVIPSNQLSTIEVNRTGTTGTIDVNGVEVLNTTVLAGTCTINGLGISSTSSGSGILSDVEITDAGTLVRDYPIDETWVGPSTVLVDKENAQDGTAINIDLDDSEPFTFDGSVSPNTWTNVGATRVLEVAGT